MLILKVIQIVKILFLMILLSSSAFAQDKEMADIWEPFKFFIGEWEGRGEGKGGISTGEQEFQLVLNGKFLQVKNKSVFEPQEKNPEGETHEDWGLFSFDENRKKFVFRQFHVEGFVNQYILDSLSTDGKTFVFVTEEIENIPSGWRARLTYEIRSENEFNLIFELAPPGENFEVCQEGNLKRKDK